jgi:hypothetical protein
MRLVVYALHYRIRLTDLSWVDESQAQLLSCFVQAAGPIEGSKGAVSDLLSRGIQLESIAFTLYPKGWDVDQKSMQGKCQQYRQEYSSNLDETSHCIYKNFCMLSI